MANKIKFGLCDVKYAMATETVNPSTGAVTTSYGAFKAIPGAVNLSLSAEGENTNFYADNGIYVVLGSNQGYSGNFECALLPEYAETDLLNRVKDSNGVVSENANNSIPPFFALSFRIEGDVTKRKYILYRCALTRPDIAGATKEASVTPSTDTLNITCTPRPDEGLVFAHTTEDTSTAIMSAWDDAVYVIGTETAAVTVALNKAVTSIVDGESETLVATATTGASVTWESSDENVATVTSGGVVTAVDPGVCVIIAKATKDGEAAVATCTVNVTAAEE